MCFIVGRFHSAYDNNSKDQNGYFLIVQGYAFLQIEDVAMLSMQCSKPSKREGKMQAWCCAPFVLVQVEAQPHNGLLHSVFGDHFAVTSEYRYICVSSCQGCSTHFILKSYHCPKLMCF
jgi:hypothetical protein